MRLRAYKHCWLFSQSHAQIYDPWRFSREDRFYRACWLVLAAKKLGRWYFRLLYKQTWLKWFLNARLRFVSKTTWNRFREQKEDSLVCWYTSRELFYDSLRTFSQVNLAQYVYYYAMNLYLHSRFSFLLYIYFFWKSICLFYFCINEILWVESEIEAKTLYLKLSTIRSNIQCHIFFIAITFEYKRQIIQAIRSYVTYIQGGW